MRTGDEGARQIVRNSLFWMALAAALVVQAFVIVKAVSAEESPGYEPVSEVGLILPVEN